MKNAIYRPLYALAVLVALVAMLFSAAPVFAKDGDGTAPYVVKGGENLTQIAKKYGLTVERLLEVNPQIKDANKLIGGQTITLPSGRNEGPESVKKSTRLYRWQLEKDGKTVSADDRLYLVKSGDSFIRIAKAYGISVERLQAANPQVEDTSKVYRGELLRIPSGGSENVPTFYFTPPSTDSK